LETVLSEITLLGRLESKHITALSTSVETTLSEVTQLTQEVVEDLLLMIAH